MTNQDATKFEFLLTLGKNIVCQRFFNVRDHNSQARRSMDLHEYVKDICEEISYDLKSKTLDYLTENQDYFYGLKTAEPAENDEKEYFLLVLKLGEDVFIQRMFPSNIYHPKVRYTVDIRPSLKRYLSDLTAILSSEELETTYLNYQL
jgi:hypothetical protein